MKTLRAINNPYQTGQETAPGSLTSEETEWLTTDEAAQYLRVTPGQLRNLTSSGKVPYYKLGRSNRYRRDQLKKLLLAEPKGGDYGN